MNNLSNQFNLLYRQLWKIDTNKFNKINSSIKLESWLGLSENELKDMREQVAILMPTDKTKTLNHVIQPIKPTTTSYKLETPAVLIRQHPHKQVTHIQKPIHQMSNKQYNWEDLVEQIKQCTACNLSKTRSHVVIERGNRNAKWMFIGEAPGEKEDLQGVPFVGASGELLNKMIDAMKLDVVNDVYICNIVKCRPPYNRNPEIIEIEQCSNYVYNQIRLVNPTIIIALGKLASNMLLNTNLAINKLRNKIHDFEGIPVIATFHPSYLLRNTDAKKDAWIDLQLAMKVFSNNANKN